MAFWRVLGLLTVVLMSAACQKLGLVKEYEYDERMELALDGSAIVDVNASIPALVALRGADLRTDPEARFDRRAFARLYEAPGVTVRDVSAFRRHGRRFAHIRLAVDDITRLQAVAPLAWSRYLLERSAGEFRFVQHVGAPVGKETGDVGWSGDELIAFRVHLPSRIRFHNSPIGVERGNILVWEQPLRDRLAGAPLTFEARMDTESILYRTLWLFGATFASAMAVLAIVVLWVSRKGKREVPA